MVKKKNLKLLVMFDTNVLFTQVASDLVRHDVKKIVQENSRHPDLEIEWYLPDVVVGERKYQMMGKAKELLVPLQKIEKLLGHNFGIGEDTLELHVDKAIRDSTEECGFHTATIDIKQVDWNSIIHRSVMREPPFEANEKEKGFRDSIIAQSFLHLHKSSPSTPTVCRLAFISDDQRLREYVTELTVGSNNVRILSNLDELESLINTLVSTIPEEFAADLAKKAGKLFYDFDKNENDNKNSLYLKEKITDRIKERYSKELDDSSLPGLLKNGSKWFISKPIFIKKERQCIHWSTTIEREFEIFHYGQEDLSQTSAAPVLGTQAYVTPQTITKWINVSTADIKVNKDSWAPIEYLRQQGLLNSATQKKFIDLTGRDKFEIRWSATLTQAQNLNSPKLEDILYVGNNLAEGIS